MVLQSASVERFSVSRMRLSKIYFKLDRVAPLMTYPLHANSTTMHSWAVCQDRNLCLGEPPYLSNLILNRNNFKTKQKFGNPDRFRMPL